ncbi:unnamed protein product [Cyclocybe aegerita]|uniref:Uncharacterized protein n=1 Tax=Cyclocybe aegerita TaxID=1973307 RepID=A0A8S0XIA9_CYCAE|nr:unnamed protein product [Cyclocybe aegerita]
MTKCQHRLPALTSVSPPSRHRFTQQSAQMATVAASSLIDASHSSGVLITGGNFNQNIIHKGVGAGKGIKALYTHVDPGLFHNSRERGRTSMCPRCKLLLPIEEDKDLVSRITNRSPQGSFTTGSKISTVVE